MENANKIILGLDLGTNSIGWALIDQNFQEKYGKILGMGSRIIPMGAELSKFEQGQAQTKNANRRIARGARKLNKRYKQRRNKLIYILQELEMLPEQIQLSETFDNPSRLSKVSILPVAKKQIQHSALDLLELRVKALHEKISLRELGKLIYWFNQLRGYSGSGSEPEKENDIDEDSDELQQKNKESYVTMGKILSISGPEYVNYKGKETKKFKIVIDTENGVLEGETFLDTLKVNESMELLVSITRSKKYGETILFKIPNRTSWRKKMENLEKELTTSSIDNGREVFLSEYFLTILKQNKWAKIRNNVILRQRYQSEFDAIWKEQSKHHSVLCNMPAERLSNILNFIFPGASETQAKYRREGLEKGLYHVIRNQVIYYQRDLKDQTHLISKCRFEVGEKVVAKSHPVFQEYKIWEQINKLTINTKIERTVNSKNIVTYEDKPIPTKLKEWLYDELQEKQEVSFGAIFTKLKKEFRLRDGTDFLNGLNPKAKLKGNETKHIIKKAIGQQLWNQLQLDKVENQTELWDILYNEKGNEYDLTSDRTSKTLKFLEEKSISIATGETAINISKIKFSRNYAALSLKAIEHILPLVRAGKYFNYELTESLKEKITRLLNENVIDPFEKATQEYLENNADLLMDGGIMNAYATILAYGRHTTKEYNADELITSYHAIRRLSQGELRNPLVEQLVNEALILVKDLWKQYEVRPNQINIELARELKNNAERRAKTYSNNLKNQKANENIKSLLMELKQETTLANIEKYKLWLSQENLNEKFVNAYKDPSKSELEKMRLWKEQGHVSPYTGQPIPLAELFNRERYDVDHIIPKSRYFDDSFTNKVICEKAVNKEKGNRTAMEYFEVGSLIPSVLSKTNFIDLVNKLFTTTKRRNLLATKVPEDPIARQIKETQYISIKVKDELSKIVGNANVKATTGGVTDYLRNQWGLTDKFKHMLKERYEKIQPALAEAAYSKYIDANEKDEKDADSEPTSTNTDTNKEAFIRAFDNNFIQKKNNKLIIKEWSKRIDHRHHAIDALVVACTQPIHIGRLNNLNKELQTWLEKNKNEVLPGFDGTPYELLEEILALEESKRNPIFKHIEKFRQIEMPWNSFAEDAEAELQNIVVSQKPKDKLLVQGEKKHSFQVKIRAQLHEGTLYGISQGTEAYKIPLNKLAGKKFATEKTIDKVVNEDLKNALKMHLKDFNNKKEEAFSAEGILAFNKKLMEKVNKSGKYAPHTPVASIKVFYRDPQKTNKKKRKEAVEETLQRLDRKKAYNRSLYVKTGDNYLFAIMEKDGRRHFDLITLFDAANLIREALSNAGDKKTFDKEVVFKQYFEGKNRAKLLFMLRQGDAVYVPDGDEAIELAPDSPAYGSFWSNKKERSPKIHYVTKYSGNEIYFIGHCIAKPILNKVEFGSQNCYQTLNGVAIKNTCIKLIVDRLGNITPAM